MFQKIQVAQHETEESLDVFIQRLMRLVLAATGLFVFFVDPVISGLPNSFTYALLIFY